MSLCFLDAVHVKILPQVTPRVSEDEARRGAGRLWEGRRVAPQPGLPEFRPPAVPRGWVPLPGAAGCGAASYDDCVAEQKIPASPGLHSSPERLRAGLGRRRRSLGGSTGSPRGDFSRGFSTAPPVPPHPPPSALGPRLPLWLRSGGSCGRRLGCRRLSALSSPSCHRGGGLQGRLRCCRAGPSPAARTTTRGPWLRRLGGGGAGVSWASRRRRAGGWLASCATSCMGTPEQSPRS